MVKGKSKKYQKASRIIFGVILAFIFGWIMLWGSNSFYNTHRLRKELAQMNARVTKLSAVNDSLRTENEKLKTSLEAAEKAARERFGLVKPGEKVFRFIPAPEEESKK